MNATDPLVAMHRQDIIDYWDLFVRGISNYPIDTAGLAIGTGANTSVKVANTVHFCSKGVAKSKTTAEVAFTTTTDDIPANAASVQEATWAVCVDGSGTLSMIRGAIASGAGNSLMPERSAIADGLAVLGLVTVAVAAAAPAAGTNFVANTTALNDARLVGSAATYVNFIGPGGCMPKFATAR